MKQLTKKLKNIIVKQKYFYQNNRFEKELPLATPIDLQEIYNKRLPLDDFIKDQILQKGPMSFNTFMDHCLLHQEHGYYMKKDVFNAKGDFITSPEISQLFGEMIGVWIINFISQIKLLASISQPNPKKVVRLLEIGPGRGTLMSDILRILASLNLLNGIEVNFIEFSPFMRQMQQENINRTLQKNNFWMEYEFQIKNKNDASNKIERFINSNKNNFLQMNWYSTYEEFLQDNFYNKQQSNENINQECPVIVLAHELFDALPVHIFEYQKNGWTERLITNCFNNNNKNRKYEWVNSEINSESVNKILCPDKLFSKETQSNLLIGDTIEVSVKSAILINSLSELIAINNGAILAMDYGENHAFRNSIRGIRKHKYIPNDDILEYPGECDLSVYVNFNQLKTVAERVQGIKGFPLITQNQFLEQMGIATRVKMLCQDQEQKVRNRLESEYKRLTDLEQMGFIYKFLYIGKQSNGDVFPFLSNYETPEIYY